MLSHACRMFVTDHIIQTTLMSDTDEPTFKEEENLTEVGQYPTLEQAQEHGLVILAMRQPCWVSEADHAKGYTLHAEAGSAPAVSRELADYDAEQEIPAGITEPDPGLFRYPAGWPAYACWALSLILIHLLQLSRPTLMQGAASSSIALIRDHEWWRPFTALFLHADASHLFGNLLSGMFFGTLVSRSIGPLKAWLLILLVGTIGNTLTSVVTWPESFVSIGSSTAVFGALGILSGLGFSFMRLHRRNMPWARTVAPVVAGIIILGWLGGGRPDGDTDVLGHVFGFSSGLVAGILASQANPATAGAWTGENARAEHDAPP